MENKERPAVGRNSASDLAASERGPAQQAPAKTGTVTEFTENPRGETDGLRLDDGTQVRFRPEAEQKVTGGVSLRDRVTIEGWTHSGEAEMHVATIE